MEKSVITIKVFACLAHFRFLPQGPHRRTIQLSQNNVFCLEFEISIYQNLQVQPSKKWLDSLGKRSRNVLQLLSPCTCFSYHAAPTLLLFQGELWGCCSFTACAWSCSRTTAAHREALPWAASRDLWGVHSSPQHCRDPQKDVVWGGDEHILWESSVALQFVAHFNLK